MDDTQNDFSPMLIEQQIDDPDLLLSPESAQLVHEMHAMFEHEMHAGIERGWRRLMKQRAGSAQPPEALDLSNYRQRRERTSTRMHDNTLSSALPPNAMKKRISRFFGLVAAALVCSLLVGSLALVLGTSRGAGPSTLVGSHMSATSVPTPTATPLVIPASCKDAQDRADEVLCAESQETTINITRRFSVTLHNPNGSVKGTGVVDITFLRAYADPTRLLLAYTINQAPDLALGNDWGGLTTLSTAQGDFGSYGSNMSKGFFVQTFDTSGLSLRTAQLQVRTISTAFGKSLPLAFTLPFHAASTTVKVGQSFTQNGYTLTLDRIILTGSATTVMYTSAWSGKTGAGGAVLSITINGQDQNFKESAGTSSGNATESSGSISAYQPLLGHPGTWKVKMALVQMHMGSSGPVNTILFTTTFIFTI